MPEGSYENERASTGSSESIGESGVRVKDAPSTHLSVRKSIFYFIARVALIGVLSFCVVSVSVTKSVFAFFERQDCLTELRTNRDTAAHHRAEADSRRDRAVDLIIIDAANGVDIDHALAQQLEAASLEVQRKEEILEQANRDFANYNDTCPSATSRIIPKF